MLTKLKRKESSLLLTHVKRKVTPFINSGTSLGKKSHDKRNLFLFPVLPQSTETTEGDGAC